MRRGGGMTLPTVRLEDIADKLEEISDGWEQYLNTTTGEFVALSNGMYIEADEDFAEEIENSCNYVRLPNQYDIHEYSIMEGFAAATPEANRQARLFRALNGRKPYRHFKDEIIRMGLEKSYYVFRHQAYVEIAKAWCRKHDITFTIDSLR